jgi:hypothetical protein
MTKLISLTLNNKLGILQAQTVYFVQDQSKLIQVKGNVGAGKSSVNNAIAIGMSGGSERELPIDLKKYENLDVEECICMGETPVYMHTKYEDGKLSSSVYIKDKDGKKSTNPIINGTKFTAAALRDYLKTELTFGVEAFISEDSRTQFDFMTRVYKEKLKEKGIVFDKKSTDYQGSLLYELDQAKLERSRRYDKVAELNAFKTRLESEGYVETAIPEFINIDSIEYERKAAVKAYYDSIAEIDAKISDTKVRASAFNAVFSAYNSSLDTQKQLADQRAKAEVDDFNASVSKLETRRLDVKKAADILLDEGFDFNVMTNYIESLPAIPQRKEFIPTPELAKIAIDEKGRYVRSGKYNEEVEAAFTGLDNLRNEAVVLLQQKDAIKEPEDGFTERIEAAKKSNLVASRWAAFFEHQRADENVKSIFSKYRKLFTTIDLGVEGLKMSLLGDDKEVSNEIRTTYNGAHNPEFFGNTTKEARNIASYSLTQKNVLAILMQIYLLEQKKKRGEEGLRYLFLDVPIDNKTKDLLIDIQQKYDLQLLVSSTGDYEQATLGEGEILVDGGYLLSKEVK